MAPSARFAWVVPGLLAACAGVVDPPTTDGTEPSLRVDASPVVPSESASSSRRGLVVRTASGWKSCAALAAGATAQVEEDLEAICSSESYDPGCACPGQTAGREAFERLLEAGESARLLILAEADTPAARAYAREAMERTGGWTVERIEAALNDDSVVASWHTPKKCDAHVEHLSTAGLNAALSYPDREAVLPVLRSWSAKKAPVGLPTALYRSRGENWIGTDRLQRIIRDAGASEEVRVAAAFALAHRGERVRVEPLHRLARSKAPWVARVAVETLDRLGDADAWRILAPAEPHLGEKICVEPWECEGHCVHLWSCEEHEGRVCAAILRLGAHLVPGEAAAVIDQDAHGLHAVYELPPHLFATRASDTVCHWPWWRSWTDDERQESAALAAALGKLPKRVRCEALRVEGPGCVGPVEARAFALSPKLAISCGIDPPAAASR